MNTRILSIITILSFLCFQAFAINIAAADHDGDGVVDTIDLDDDNDGISDEQEAAAPLVDMDFDGIPNYLDLDSDNDGISDAVEAGLADTNGDGVIDNFVDTNEDGLSDQLLVGEFIFGDFDGDNLPNWIDLDSNNDGISDVLEANAADVNGDGRLDDFRDSDNDGLNDKVDGDIGNMLAPGDVSPTATSHHALHLPQYKAALRLVKPCEDTDRDGLCDEYDGDLGNVIRPSHDFVIK